jgi:hypothetical protein
MAKRKTVNIICNKVIPLIEKNEWSNAAFSRKVGKYSSWFGEVLRGNNLPSPEEAAQMCLLLNTTPEEILLGVGETEEDTAKLQADIALVRGLIEQEREQQGIKKDPTQTGEVDELTETEWGDAFDRMSKEKQRSLLDMLMKRYLDN